MMKEQAKLMGQQIQITKESQKGLDIDQMIDLQDEMREQKMDMDYMNQMMGRNY